MFLQYLPYICIYALIAYLIVYVRYLRPVGPIEEQFVAIWCVLMPVTGTLLFSGLQGTIPAYMMAFLSFPLVYLKVRSGEMTPAVGQYMKSLLIVTMIWLFLLVTSQMGLIMSNRFDFESINLMDPNDTTTVVFRKTIFTQSLYLLACVFIALYFRYFFQERWLKYVYWGALFLALYGIYEWLFYLIFQQSGDILVNRAFGDHTASWTQGISFGGINMVRIKSTLGEPTFFSGVVIPYLFLALDGRQKVLSGLLLFTAVFSTSTALYLTLPAVLFIQCFWSGVIKWRYLGIFGLVALFIFGMAMLFPETFRGTFEDKFSGNNDSGSSRLNSLANLMDLLDTYTIPNWLFGVGFGTAYLSILTGLLVNTGFVGLIVFLYVILKPLILLPAEPGSEGLKAALLGILVLGSLSLSELFLPTTWMFFGIAYWKLDQLRLARQEANLRAAEAYRARFLTTRTPTKV